MRTFCFLLTIILFASCTKSKYDSEKFQLRYDGQSRSYLLHLPNGYDESTSYPLIIALHVGTSMVKNIDVGFFQTSPQAIDYFVNIFLTLKPLSTAS